MVSCLILYHQTITSLTKCFMLRVMFTEEELEIHVEGDHTVYIFLWNVDKSAVWQAALMFELTNIMTGYGFGKRKEDAESEARKILYKRIALEYKQKPFVKENKAKYYVDMAE